MMRGSMRLLSMMRNDEREHEAPIHDESKPTCQTKVSHTLLTVHYRIVPKFIWFYLMYDHKII
jgi:hypothetical protein